MKISDFIPRFMRPKRWRWHKLTCIRNDTSRHRYERILCLAKIYGPAIENEVSNGDSNRGKQWDEFKVSKDKAAEILTSIGGCLRPDKWLSRENWRGYYGKLEAQAEQKREFSHIVHSMHMLLVAVMPFKILKLSIPVVLFDLRTISSPEAYSIAAKGLESYAPNQLGPDGDEEDMRAKLLYALNEYRRQSLALPQMEILRDGVTRELFVAATRLGLVILFLGILVFAAYGGKLCNGDFAFAVILVALGGIIGSVVSSLVRIGRMVDNLDTARTLGLLGGATRSMRVTPLIGCLAGLVFFTFSCLGILPDFGILDLRQLAMEAQESPLACIKKGWPPCFPGKFLLGSFALGTIAGFSERLVHDLVDRFNKAPTPKSP